MRKDLTPLKRERLIVAVQLEDAVESINTALRARKAEFILDYTNGIYPQLMVNMPGSKPQTWMVANARTKRCTGCWPPDPDLAAIVRDIMERMEKLEAHLAIGVVKRPNQKTKAKLQIFFRGAQQTAITLFEVERGLKKAQTHFLLPKELIS